VCVRVRVRACVHVCVAGKQKAIDLRSYLLGCRL